MLLLLTGANCAGKTTAARALADHAGLAVHDADEDGVPSDAGAVWRQQSLDGWVRRAADLEAVGTDVLLTGQSPLGELLAAPSAHGLDAAAVCLLDVADAERRRRIAQREDGRWPTAAVEAQVSWGRWHRGHAVDPAHLPDAITLGAWPGMVWSRWHGWTARDPRWRTTVIDTTGQTPQRTTAAVRAWLAREREERRNPFT